ncbi:MerC family mercury resistance protein [Kiloniella sp.]|uniref:MerC family mercury resistance protein n=1 Tax=Kiloniella sp. TaxID=1938587 RepID=UPI003B02D9F1
MKTDNQSNQCHVPKIGMIAGICATFSVVLCYGTLMFISLLNHLGVAISLNETLWAGGIVTTASLAVFGLILGLFRHKNPWPTLIGGSGAVIIAYAMYVNYHFAIELSGFCLLSLAALWDWRSKKLEPLAVAG